MNKGYLKICDFDHSVYETYEDLKSLNTDELENHFLEFGIPEGRYFNLIRNRSDFVNSISKTGKMLEIEPLDKPQLDYLSPDYYSLDVFNREQLTQNYINDPNVNKDKIIEPSFVISNNDYSQIKEKFESIFSSHGIQHMPCIVTFLNNLEGLLTDDGSVYLIIPDKRYCFDYFKRETDIYDVLQEFYDKSSRPKFTDVLKMATQITHNNCVDHWSNIHGMVDSRAGVINNFEQVLVRYDTGVYIDAHVSCFTPESFREIIEILKQLKLINLEIHRLYHTLRNNIEFYVILKRVKRI